MIEPLRPSQEAFLAWAADRFGMLLDGGMGVGKTRCAIEFMRRADIRVALIMAPVSVLPAWESQLHKYDDAVEVILHRKGTISDRCAAIDMHLRACLVAQRRCVILCNYEMSSSNAFGTLVGSRRWPLLVLDESHRIKSPQGKTARMWAKARRRVDRVLAMTGTPMPHSPLDIYAQMRVIAPETLGSSYVMFRARYAIMGGFEGHEVIGFKHLEDLRQRISVVTYQIPRSVLALDKPTDIEMPVELSTKEWKAYRSMEKDLIARVDSGEVVAANALTKLLRLQQITSGCVPVDDGEGDVVQERLGDSKEVALRELLDALPADEPVVVFCRFKADLAAVHRAAAEAEEPRTSLELSGSRHELERWQQGEATILAVQVQSGSIGIDLTRACVGAFFSTSWSLGEFDQARCRIDRPPQARPVSYYHLIATPPDALPMETIDRKVQRALVARRDVITAVLSDLKAQREVPDMMADGRKVRP